MTAIVAVLPFIFIILPNVPTKVLSKRSSCATYTSSPVLRYRAIINLVLRADLFFSYLDAEILPELYSVG